jgi:hypothetical protein
MPRLDSVRPFDTPSDATPSQPKLQAASSSRGPRTADSERLTARQGPGFPIDDCRLTRPGAAVPVIKKACLGA